MSARASGHFAPFSLHQPCDARREQLAPSLCLQQTSQRWYGNIGLLGIPFSLGAPDQLHLARRIGRLADRVDRDHSRRLRRRADRGRWTLRRDRARRPHRDLLDMDRRARARQLPRLRGDVAAHISAMQVLVGDVPIFAHLDAVHVLTQLAGVTAYLDTLAPRSAGPALLRIRATIKAAYQRLHRRLHQQGLYHQHSDQRRPI